MSLDQTELKKSLANDLDWTKFGKIILTPLIDIDNLNLFKIKPLLSLMIKREKNKDISVKGRNSVLR